MCKYKLKNDDTCTHQSPTDSLEECVYVCVYLQAHAQGFWHTRPVLAVGEQSCRERTWKKLRHLKLKYFILK